MKTTTKRMSKMERTVRYNEALAGQANWNEHGAWYRAQGKLEEAQMCGEQAFKYQMEARKYEE